VKNRFAELDLMQNLPFKFPYKVLLPEQVVRGSTDVPICFGMATQVLGRGCTLRER
jgi:hypothetical protein